MRRASSRATRRARSQPPPDWTEATREAFADRIEAILSRHIRDFDRIKLARRAYSPADLAAMNINLVGGDPYGGACSIDQFFLWRPFPQSTNGTVACARPAPHRRVHPSRPRPWRRLGLSCGKGAWRMTDQRPIEQRLGEIGLQNFAPYLMNRIMGRYNASLRDEMARAGPDHAQDARAGGAVGRSTAPLIRELAVYAVVEQSHPQPRAGRAGDRGADPARDRCRRQPRAPASSSPMPDAPPLRRSGRTWPRLMPGCSAASPTTNGAPSWARLQKMLRNIRKHEI